jgi:hypothetical protein
MLKEGELEGMAEDGLKTTDTTALNGTQPLINSIQFTSISIKIPVSEMFF